MQVPPLICISVESAESPIQGTKVRDLCPHTSLARRGIASYQPSQSPNTLTQELEVSLGEVEVAGYFHPRTSLLTQSSE